MENRLDIIIFGATGYTGKYLIREVQKLSKTDGKILTWGIAGRSEQKLKATLKECADKIGSDALENVPIILADACNEESVKKMTARARIIVNSCGPFQLYGEVVVKSCIDSGTHYVDVTAETFFIESIEAKYSEAARNKGVYIVSACGLESLTADMGLVFMENNFQGTLNSVEVYVECYEEDKWTSGPIANFATWHSGIQILQNFWKLVTLRRNTAKTLPTLKPSLRMRYPFQKVDLDDKGSKWILPFNLSTDYDVTKRSQCYFYEHNKKRPVQTQYYLTLDTFMKAFRVMFYASIIFILSQFQLGRNLLLQYPKFFSCGLFSSGEPSEYKMDRLRFSFTFRAEGWSQKLTEDETQYKTPPNKIVTGRIIAVNPGYSYSAKTMLLSAITILIEPTKLPANGGVYTTAVAFSKTSLIERLKKNGIVYEILSVKDKNV